MTTTGAMTRIGCGLLLAVGLGCSSSDSPAKDSGPRWPDGLGERDAVAPGADGSGPAADAAAKDVEAPDVGPPPDATFDGDLPAPGPWKVFAVPAAVSSIDLHAVACVAGHVFTVGDQGTIMHLAPGKTAFSLQDSQTIADLHAVSFADTSYGVVAGKAPQIWMTDNLGEGSWVTAPQCSAYVFDAFYALHLDTADDGFAAGVAVDGKGAGAKYRSGGGSWTCVSPTYPAEEFYDVFRLGDSGWVVGDAGGKIYRTEDKGVTWAAEQTSSSAVLRGVHFASAQLGVAVGDKGAILRSTDGEGKVWTTVTAPTGADLHDVFLWDGQNGWAVGAGGTVLHSTDGGASWQAQGAPTAAKLEGVCFNSPKDGWAVGTAGTVIHTTTGGL